MRESHFKCLCIVNPKHFNSSADYIVIFSISIFGFLTFLGGIWNTSNLDFFMLIDNLFNLNQSATFVNSKLKILRV